MDLKVVDIDEYKKLVTRCGKAVSLLAEWLQWADDCNIDGDDPLYPGFSELADKTANFL